MSTLITTPDTASQHPAEPLILPLLQVVGVSKQFPIRQGFLNRVVGQVSALDDVSLTVMPGETLGLVGESGCGKSTLGRVILQLIPATSGQVLFDGQELTTLSPQKLRPLRQQFQMVFQNPYTSLNPRMRIGEAIAEPLIIHHTHKGPALQARVRELLDQVGLPQDAVHKFPHEFSGGQRQRVGIARALALNPKLIVADEPVSALDVSIQAQILNLLKDLRDHYGLAYLFIAHHLGVVHHISHRVAVMYLGRIVEIAPAEALYAAPRHPYTQALLSAVPVDHPRDRDKPRVVLSGEIPNPAHPPSGCRFRIRCAYATEQCAQAPPPLAELSPGHQVACYHPLALH